MVLVYSEEKDVSKQLLGLAHSLKTDTPIVAVSTTKEDATELIAHGADKVVIATINLQHFKAEEYSQLLQQIFADTKETLLLVGGTRFGRELAGRLAGLLGITCQTDATEIALEKNTLSLKRIVYSGNAQSSVSTPLPAVLTVPKKAYEPLAKDDSRKGEIEEISFTADPSKNDIKDIQKRAEEGVNVEEAPIIISCGRGVKDKADVQLLSALAQSMRGAVLGCSRPIAADLKWLSEDHWVGLSGHKVKPKLYIAAGISGQIQHIAGMRDSAIVVAINKDPEALIFNSADYGIVGDLYDIIPKLTEKIKEKTG